MASQSTDLLTSIGVIQTLVENFPMGILTSKNVKKYNTSLEFMLDALRTIGVNDKDIISFVLEELVGVNGIDYEGMYEQELKYQNNAFIQTLEKAIKHIIALILSNIISCSIWPKIPDWAIDDGIELPLTAIDPTHLLDVCPYSENGQKLYSVSSNEITPETLSGCTDLNAFIWYCLNKILPMESEQWGYVGYGDVERQPICWFENHGYKRIFLKVDPSFRNKTLFKFNREYLESITIFSPKIILTNIIDELINGLPNMELNIGIETLYNEAVLKKMIDTVVSNDDMGVDDCFYTFSNEDWIQMLEESELKKYDARKRGTDTKTAAVINKESLYDSLNKASSAATLHDKLDIVSDAIYDAAKTQTIEYGVLEGGYEETSMDARFEVNSAWLYNILSSIIRPIIKSAMTPKVIALLLLNYEIAGAMDLTSINTNSLTETTISFINSKMHGVFAALIKKAKDLVLDVVLKLFKKYITPLIIKFTAAKLMESLQNYTELLMQALDCIDLFGVPYLFGNGAKTAIDDVTYADITQVKNKPEQTPC